MMIFSRYILHFIFYVLCLIEASQICKSWVSASSSDMLIIRHGRSRVRHSSEKSHLRWGLQAFDNLTLYDYDYENSNGTNGGNETFFDFGSNGANQTFLGTESFVYFSPETVINNGTYASINSDSKLISTLAPSSVYSTPPKYQKLVKKKMMENIRKNVEEGIQYLRTHSHLSHPTAVMPSGKELQQSQNQSEQLEGNQRIAARAEQSEVASQEMASFPMSEHFTSEDPFSHADVVHNQSNSKNHKVDEHEFQFKPHQVDDIPKTNVMDNHDTEDDFDYEWQNDEQYIENVHQSENHSFKANKLNKSNPRHIHESSSAGRSSSIATMKTIDSIVTNINAAVSKRILNETINNVLKFNLNGMANPNVTKANLRSQSNINSKTASRSQSSNEKRKESQAQNAEIPVSSVASLVLHTFDPESKKKNYSAQSNVKYNTNLNIQLEGVGFLSPIDEMNDEQQANDESIDEANTFPFDANYEQSITLDDRNINANDVNQPSIFRMEDIDLDDFDEISRNNRLNLKKGRDLVTKFLQIVESQHLLGANCTAGTALNLGEGVVDRYAQDRFRVEANVAVNRANMLTRYGSNVFLFCSHSNVKLDRDVDFSLFC